MPLAAASPNVCCIASRSPAQGLGATTGLQVATPSWFIQRVCCCARARGMMKRLPLTCPPCLQYFFAARTVHRRHVLAVLSLVSSLLLLPQMSFEPCRERIKLEGLFQPSELLPRLLIGFLPQQFSSPRSSEPFLSWSIF